MSAPNHNNTVPAARSSTSASVPKWGEAGFVAIEGARFGEDGFVPCGRLGHSAPRANLQHTAEECRFGAPLRRATNRVPRRETSPRASTSGRGRGRQNYFPGSGQQSTYSGFGQETTYSGYGQQNTYPGFGHPINISGHGHHQQQFGYGQQTNLLDLGLQLQQQQRLEHQRLQQQWQQQQQQQQQQRLQLQLQQQQQQFQQMQNQLLAQQLQQQPSAYPSRRGGRQGPSVDKNKKRGADDDWQSGPRKRNKRGSSGAGGGAGGQTSV